MPWTTVSFMPNRLTAVEWNALDNSVVHAESADGFKTLLTKRLATNH
jgi:hypothetical protein